MSAEWFFKLKEFDSLGKMRIKHLKEIQEQRERLTSLNVKRQENIDESSALRTELLSVQQAYFDSEKKMITCEEQAARLQDVGGDQKKVASFKNEAAELENWLFTLLEQTESIQLSLNEKKTFLIGLEKTFKEIENEVNEEIKIHQNGISQTDMRMDLIKEELPKEFQETLERTLKKNLAVGSFTKIDKGSCFFCRYKISRTDESEIDQQFKLKICPQCSRIFLPFSG